MFKKSSLPLLIFPVLMLFLILSETKIYSTPPQTLHYHTCIYEIPVYKKEKWQTCGIDLDLMEKEVKESYRNSAWFVFGLRYKIFSPSFGFSNNYVVDIDKASSYQILCIFVLLLLFMRFIASELDNIDFSFTSFFIFALFLLMNGRLAPSLLGVSMLISAIILVHRGKICSFLSIVFSLLGLFLSIMSTGFFISTLTLYFLLFFTKIGFMFHNQGEEYLSNPWKNWVKLFHFLIFIIGVIFLIPLGIRLYSYFGGGISTFTGSFQHGMGKYLVQSNLAQGLVIAVTLLSLLGIILIWNGRKEIFNILKFHASSVAILCLVMVPMPFIIFGYSAAVPSIVGISLLAGRLSFLMRMRVRTFFSQIS